MRLIILLALSVCALVEAQTTINLGTEGRDVDFSAAPFTKPVKVGTVLPATCGVGELFFDTASPAGQNLFGCTAPNTWSLLGSYPGLPDPGANGLVLRAAPGVTTAMAEPSSPIVGTNDPQTLTNKSIDASEITGVLPAQALPPFSGDVSLAGTVATLATVNPNPGTYGDGTHTVQLTVDAKGRITAISQTNLLGSNGNSSIAAGPLANLSSSCNPGALYIATDQPAGQQLYTCSAPNIWTQNLSVGPSGALAVTNGSVDIVPSVVPTLPGTNIFTGLNTFPGIELQGGSEPACSLATRGLLWFENNGTAKDSLQICAFDGQNTSWATVF